MTQNSQDAPTSSGTTSGVNLNDGIDANDVMGLLEQVMANNGGNLNLPAGTVPANVTQLIQNHYQTNGSLSNVPTSQISPEHLRAIKAHLQTAAKPGAAQHKG